MKFFKNQDDQQESIIRELRQKISSAHMPQPVEKIAGQELDMISRISPSSAEYTIGITYIDYLVSLPWNKKTEDILDLARAERILNENHYGLSTIKERVLEHLAVKVLMMSKKARILIVDDEEVARKNLAHVLTKEAYDVVAVADGEGALRELEASEFDVVLTDLRMGRIDGMDLLDRVRMRYPETRVIMVTGFATVPSAIEAMQKGAFHYIAKPFQLDEWTSDVFVRHGDRWLCTLTHLTPAAAG
jgi:ATP-dependent Lon protease